MRKTSIVLVLASSLGAFGCDSGPVRTADAGSDSGPPPVIVDSGGGGTDTGPRDSGPPLDESFRDTGVPLDLGSVDGGAADLGARDLGVDAGTSVDAGSTADSGAAFDAGPDAQAATDAGPQTFSIRFRAEVGNQPFACGTTYDVGVGSTPVDFIDYRFYVHGVELVRADGSSVPLTITDEAPWQARGVALLDFENRTGTCNLGNTETRDIVRGTAPAGTYVGVRFVLGIPFDLNHVNPTTLPSPLDIVDALHWGWQSGFKFARIDVATPAPADGGARPAFNVHLGSTGCDGSPATGGTTMCARPNRATIAFPTGFDPATSVIVADFAELVEGVDVRVNTASTAPGCMSGTNDPECVEVMTSFGIPFTLSTTSTTTPAAMDFFRVEAN